MDCSLRCFMRTKSLARMPQRICHKACYLAFSIATKTVFLHLRTCSTCLGGEDRANLLRYLQYSRYQSSAEADSGSTMDDDFLVVLPARHRLILDDQVIREIACMPGWWSLLGKLCQTLQGISGCALRRSSDHHRTGKVGRTADLLPRW